MNRGAMVWSVRRELWENRSIYLAPLAVAAVIVLGSLAGTIAELSGNQLDSQAGKLARPYDFAALLIMAATLVVAIFYCLDALHGERRDRSILFWKSMPVSDATTVLSKAAIPLVILPLLTFVITVVTQCIMLLLNSALMILSGHSAAALWTKLPWFRMSGELLYHLLSVHSLYYAPIFAWLLLVSAWARRATFLWAFLPPAAIGIVEKIVFNTAHFAHMLESRISGGMGANTAPGGPSAWLGHVHPLEFISRPGLWIGLAIAAVFLAGAVHLRRSNDPI